jgi:DNA-binding MarR family transcriptional regulator
MYNTYMNDRPGPELAGLFALLHAADAAQAQVETSLNTIGLSLAKLAALRVLHEAGESLPLGQLADRLSCVKSNITQLVDRLEADGLVTREPDPNDRRSRLAVTTTAGRKACAAGWQLQEKTECELFGGLNADEAHQLATLLDKVGSVTVRSS